MTIKIRPLWQMFLLSLFLCSPIAFADDSAADIDALTLIGEDVAYWWGKIPKEKPLSISVLHVGVNQKVNNDFGALTESVILASFASDKNTKAIACFECRRPDIVVKDDRLIITKGVPNQEALRILAKKLDLEAFATIILTKTVFSLRALVTVHLASTGEIFASKEFSVSNVAFFDASMQFLVASGLQWDIPLSNAQYERTQVPLGIDFTWLQAVGKHTRVGLNAGTTLLARTGNLGYLTPRIAWKIQLGRSAFSLVPGVQTGFGFRIPSTIEDAIDTKFAFGLVAGASLDLFLGQFFFIGATTNGFIPINLKNLEEVVIYPGFHIGMAVGR